MVSDQTDASAAPMITIERFNDYEQTSQELHWTELSNSKFTAVYYFNNEFTQDWITGDAFWDPVWSKFEKS